MDYLSDLIYHTDVLVQLVSISFSFKLFWLSDLSTFGVSGDGCSGDSSCAVIMAVEAIEAIEATISVTYKKVRFNIFKLF